MYFVIRHQVSRYFFFATVFREYGMTKKGCKHRSCFCVDFYTPLKSVLAVFKPHANLSRVRNHFFANIDSKNLAVQFDKLVYKPIVHRF